MGIDNAARKYGEVSRKNSNSYSKDQNTEGMSAPQISEVRDI